MSAIAPFPKFAEPAPRPGLPARRHRLQVVPLSDAVAAAFFDSPADAPDDARHGQGPISARSGDDVLCLPQIASQLARAGGGQRHVTLLGLPARRLCRDGLRVLRDGETLAEIDPMALQSPLVDPLALMAGLSPDGGRRLLRLLLTTGLSLFGKGSVDGFRDVIAQLLESLTPASLPLRAWCPVGQSAAVASYLLPRGLTADGFTDLVVVSRQRVRRLSGFEIDVETSGTGAAAGRLLHVFLPQGLPVDSTLVALSDAPLRLAGPARRQPGRPLGPWLARRTPRLRQRMRDRLARLSERDDSAAALLAEIACPEADRPTARAERLMATPHGLFYILALSDPRRLLTGIALASGDATAELPLGRPLHHPRLGRLQVGFLPGIAGFEPGEEAALSLLYRSGHRARAGTARIDALPATLPPVLEALPAADLAPVLASVLGDALPARPRIAAELLPVGAPERPQRSALIVALDGSLDYPHALAATLGDASETGLILHHRDPDAVPALRRIAADLHAVHGIGVEIADLPRRDLLPAERVRAILAAVTAPVSILLAQDTLPEGADWLANWVADLDRPGPALGGAILMNHDGTLRDGLTAGTDPARLLPEACLGLNAAARARLLASPLRVPGIGADMALLAAALRQDEAARIALHPGLCATAHAAPLPRPEAARHAEDLILSTEVQP
ncbi:hypothetical protein BV509_18460 [Rhodovulum sulfidophilum]|uniref:hypothetical protein n=1 Tax=Rhodovulum visakhapatnamense TaxID=364297 RepID=UPI000951604D|nr:hypothetical protein [Rhodovulum visakhapatnamense]MBL3570280.1 hypothetical protein [Rhodovulum visakhapatnamense]OLS46138.1 hypothetical protein BV509_18460 [Rhodovulum sulfidophilum]